MKKKVLITGASGFIGRNIWEYLSRCSDLELSGTYFNHGLADMPILRQSDLRQISEALAVTEKIDYIIHTAAVTAGLAAVATDPNRYFTDSQRINDAVIEAAYLNSVPQFIFFSCTVLYPPYLGRPVRETDLDIDRIHPFYLAGAQVKLNGEKKCEQYAATGHTRFTILRHSNIYGPYDKFGPHGHAFAALAAQIIRVRDGGEIVINGDGSAERDLLSVSDLARCVKLVMDRQSPPYDVFNVGSGSAISITALARKMIQVSGKRLTIAYDNSRPSIDTKLTLDISKVREKFGWQPYISLDKGIRETLEWFSDQREKTEAD